MSAWKREKIADLPIQLIDGDRSTRYPKQGEFATNGQYPFLNTPNVNDGRLDLRQANFVSAEKFAEIRKGRLQRHDIVMTTRGTIGKVALFDCEYSTGLINAQMLILRADGKVIDPRFLFYSLCSRDVRATILNFASGSAQPQIPIRDLRDVELAYPEFPIQHRIASILSAYDDLIENNTRRIAILEEMAQSLYREWFVHFRFPGHEKVKLVESPLGPIPNGWVVRKLADVAHVNARSIERGAEPENIVYIDIASVSTGNIDTVQPMRFEDAPGRARRIVCDGDVIWSCVRPNRKSYSIVLGPRPNLIVSTGFAVLSATDVPFAFLYYAVTTDAFAEYLTNHTRGAAYPAVTGSDFEQAVLVRPFPGLLEQFQLLVEPMLRAQECLKKKNANLRTTRDLLLPKLISGEIEVSQAPKGLVEAIA